jgi:hypothetical protein
MEQELIIYGDVVMTEDQLSDLTVQLNGHKELAFYHHEGELATRTVESWDYYYGRLPEPITKGSSKWIDRSVWEAVNGTLQELIGVFTSGENAVRFMPRTTEDAIAAEAATKLVNKALLTDNRGYRALHDAFKESCIVGNSWFKRYWRVGDEVFTETFDEISRDDLELYLSQIDGELISVTIDDEVCKDLDKYEEQELLEGSVTYKRSTEGVKVEYVPFEQIIIDPLATCIQEANYIAHRVRKSKQELIEMGFDEETVKGLRSDNLDLYGGQASSARAVEAQMYNPSDNFSVGDDMVDRVWLYENYIKTSALSGTTEMLQVFTVYDQILEVSRVNEMPFETITPFPVPGNIFGESVTDITKDIQNLNTMLVRGIIDNTMNANFGRYTGLKGGYDKRSLLEGRPGGVVEITTPGAVTLLPYHALPQGNITLLEYVEQKKEQRTGVTRLGQGLNNDVLKNDNSFATVNTMMSAAQNRMRMIARNIAEEGMKRLMLGIYRIIRENAKDPILVETVKGPMTIFPNMLPRRDKMIVAVAVGNNERRERAQMLTGALQLAASSPQVGMFIQPQNSYYMATQIFEAMGIFDVQNYLTPLEDLPPPQPDPLQELTLQTAAETIKQTQAATQKILSDITEAQQKLQFEQVKAADDFAMRKEESLSKQDEAADKMGVEERKLQIEQMKLQLERDKLELKRQEIMIEAQLENKHNRPVGLGRS